MRWLANRVRGTQEESEVSSGMLFATGLVAGGSIAGLLIVFIVQFSPVNIAGYGEHLQAQLGEEPRHLAYPYGYASAVGCREVGFARDAGYASAVTTRHGVLRAEHSGFLHALPRISVNGRYQSVAHIRTMLSGVTTPLANAGKMVVTI